MPSAPAKSLAPSPSGLTAFRWAELTLQQRNSLLAAGLSWLFSGFAVMLYSALLPQLMPALGMSKSTAGFLNALMLLGTGLGSVLFGTFADRYGRKRALIFSIFTFTVFTFLSGLVAGVAALAICRFVVGLGMGGEWTSGTALVAESWPADRRARAVGIVQSGYAVGYALAVFAAVLLSPLLTWRGVFFLGLLPALFTLWLRRNVNEPAIWKAQSEQPIPIPGETKKCGAQPYPVCWPCWG